MDRSKHWKAKREKMNTKKKCFGNCFSQIDSDIGWSKGCGSCHLFYCPDCYTQGPEWYFLAHGGRCTDCAVDKYNKEVHGLVYIPKNRIPPGTCHECYKRIVPVGSSRLNGAPHNDWKGRKYHKQCWKKNNPQ
jgi:hypothetical protein